MNTQSNIRESLLRAREVLERKPSAALKEDSVAVASWNGSLSTRLQHPTVSPLTTEMPSALGGADGPSPGWYFRAGVASCMATSIAMEAAVQGIALTRLEVQAHSESDARGMLGTPGVPAGPLRFWLKVGIESPDASDEQLRALVALADSRSPMAQGLRRGLPVELDVTIEPQPAPAA
ncbi:MAG: OsmC family protein [Pseudomonadota bacterium]